MLIVIDPVLGLAASLMVPILFLTANRYAGKIIGLSFDVQERLAHLSQVVEEAVGGIQVVKAYGQEAAGAAATRGRRRGHLHQDVSASPVGLRSSDPCSK